MHSLFGFELLLCDLTGKRKARLLPVAARQCRQVPLARKRHGNDEMEALNGTETSKRD